MEFLTGGLAACFSCFFLNPFEVLKTRLQLQGELQKKGQHNVYYKNVFHASYVVAKNEGLQSLQKGLTPSLWIQFLMNGMRFGSIQFAENRGYTRDSEGKLIFYRTVLITGMGGVIGHYIANPFFLIKTQLQSEAAGSIAVGHQHHHKNMITAMKSILYQQGIKGLFRGGSAVIPRASMASVAQMTSFAYSKNFLYQYEYFHSKQLLSVFLSSMIAGVAISVVVTPFDLILTRLYNQPVASNGKGLLYSSYFDCVVKIYKTEGFAAFYKGVGPQYLRLGPHTVLCFVFFNKLNQTFGLDRTIENRN